ncbi:MAG: ATP-binding cassette domain-containing protein [Anaerolineae bacterium]|nr:ATP-binding cassette domain-containing protein [Anaerolineae bacterium]
MNIQIKGAREHNLQDVNVEIGDGLTVVTGVSGSGKTSLIFDTLYHEARRRFLEIFNVGGSLRLSPARVESITGVGPAVAVGQNLLNRNPGSTLATACGLHPFLRLLYARFGKRHCARCGAGLSMLSEDEIVERLIGLSRLGSVTLLAPLLQSVRGSHRTLLRLLTQEIGFEALVVDGKPWDGQPLVPDVPHDVQIHLGVFGVPLSVGDARQTVQAAWSLGVNAVVFETAHSAETLSRAPVCAQCGTWFGDLEPMHFHTPCPFCEGKGCKRCGETGLHPEAAATRWHDLGFPDLLALSVEQVRELFARADLPSTAERLHAEIVRRLDALYRVGLGYISLDRSSPTLSRGESQRVRLAVALTSRLEDMLHVLDEPTIGQHPADVARLLPAFRDLLGPVVYVEHDRVAAAAADRAIDIGPGAGDGGGQIVFSGTPAELWRADTPTGRYFSLRERVQIPKLRPKPDRFLAISRANLHNLQDVDIPIALGRLNVITGVSGSGKSSFVEGVLAASLAKKKPVGCRSVQNMEGARLPNVVMVDQSPIGRNPRSNPATYTKLSDIIRDFFADTTGQGLSASHFSFNRPEGACPTCKGIGALEVRMRYLPSTWIPCADCGGQRFSEEVLAAKVDFGDRLDGLRYLSIADFYELSISKIASLLVGDNRLAAKHSRAASRILTALCNIGLGYLHLGQPSPTLSGGEAQRVKLAKFLGKRSLADNLLILDEPSTGLHPQDVSGLLIVLDRLVRAGSTVVVVEHNTDIIRAADWVIDLGPGAGPKGGQLIYAGSPEGLLAEEKSITGRALREENQLQPGGQVATLKSQPANLDARPVISIRNARANNLDGVSVDFPKGELTVVTGVSGSGKSSLVGDVLEVEARRRFLESLSMYERQGTHEGPEAPVESVSGLGVAVTVSPGRGMHARRASVGSVTEIAYHLANLMAWLGNRQCLSCGAAMEWQQARWLCPSCGETASIAQPRHFNPTNYAAACKECNGVGTLRGPNPSKLIIHPEKPLCGGAMYSPGFFPKGYLCKPFNGGYYEVQGLASKYGFDPATTPWNEMSAAARQAFLFGDPEPIEVHYESRKGRSNTYKRPFPGFYRWIGDWDVGGTYTDTQVCPSCGGSKLRPEYAAVTLSGHSLHQLSTMPLSELYELVQGIKQDWSMASETTCESRVSLQMVEPSLRTAIRRLRFLLQVGLGYVHLDRSALSFSAGEAQRITLAGLLGSGLTSLTVLLDEPTRGLHPSEVHALLNALIELRDTGNTVIVVEHDLEAIRAADYLIDMGPGAGAAGGNVVAQGTPEQVALTDTVTARWLRGERRARTRPTRHPHGWMTICGARANNLRDIDVRFPLGTLVGLCGVSGSGKSTLLVDTLARALAPVKQTTSVAYEDVDPGAHDAIEGAPSRVILVDQSKRGVHSPATFLALNDPIHALYAQSEDAQALGLDEKALGQRCTVCGGGGVTRIEMGFLPDVYAPCEACQSTGYRSEAWEVRLHSVALPKLFSMTIDQVYDLLGDEDRLARPLAAAREVGLGYLVLRQPGYALSGGEAQRLKIAQELCRKGADNGGTLYILDEPTVGQHLEDVARLIGVLHRLVDDGHTVLVVEHHPHLLAACDWLVELGPGGGPDGGSVIATGTPEMVAAGMTPTAPYIKEVLREAVRWEHA